LMRACQASHVHAPAFKEQTLLRLHLLLSPGFVPDLAACFGSALGGLGYRQKERTVSVMPGPNRLSFSSPNVATADAPINPNLAGPAVSGEHETRSHPSASSAQALDVACCTTVTRVLQLGYIFCQAQASFCTSEKLQVCEMPIALSLPPSALAGAHFARRKVHSLKPLHSN
jgi:hypothetical protein